MPLHVPKNLLLLFIYQFSSQDYNNVLVQGSLHFYFQLLLCKVLKCAVCVCVLVNLKCYHSLYFSFSLSPMPCCLYWQNDTTLLVGRGHFIKVNHCLHVLTSYPGAVSTSYPGAVPTSYPGAVPTSYPGAVPTSYPGAVPTSYPGAVPTSYPGAVPTSYPGAVPTSYPGAVPT